MSHQIGLLISSHPAVHTAPLHIRALQRAKIQALRHGSYNSAAWFALKSFESLVSGEHVLIQMDNRTAVTYLNKMGGTHAKDLSDLALQIWQWSLERNIVISAEYLPGKENVIADQESLHHRDASDWKLDTQIFSPIALRWGPFSVDLLQRDTTNRSQHISAGRQIQQQQQ